MGVVFGIVAPKDKKIDRDLSSLIFEQASIHGKRRLKLHNEDSFSFGYPEFDGVQRFATCDDGRYFVFMGGECFGTQDVSDRAGCEDIPAYARSPPLFLWRLYQRHGAKSMSWLDGHFCLCCYDRHFHEFIALNDSAGQHPLYFAEKDGHLLFTSEYQIIIPLPGMDRSVDVQSLFEIFRYGLILGGKTLITGLKNLPYATEYRWKSPTEQSYRRYERWDIRENKEIGIEDAADTVFRLMKKRMAEYLSDGYIQDMPLSGGYDTRFLLGLVPKESRASIRWHTNCCPCLTEHQDRDVIIAKRLSQKFDLPLIIRHPAPPEQIYPKTGGALYEPLRPMAEWYNINGHFSGYLRGQLGFAPNFFDSDASISTISRYIRSISDIPLKDIMESASDYPADNKSLSFYYLSNICTFLNASDPLSSGKWVYPQSFFLQAIRSPFQNASLLRYLLTLPPEYLKNGHLFLSILHRHNPELLTIPFTAHPFKHLENKKILSNIHSLNEGIDYQSVRKRTWVKLFRKYLFSHATWERRVFSGRMFPLLMIKWLIEYHSLSNSMPLRYLRCHWRYRQWIPPMLDQTFVRIEAWLRTYVDPYRTMDEMDNAT